MLYALAVQGKDFRRKHPPFAELRIQGNDLGGFFRLIEYVFKGDKIAEFPTSLVEFLHARPYTVVKPADKRIRYDTLTQPAILLYDIIDETLYKKLGKQGRYDFYPLAYQPFADIFLGKRIELQVNLSDNADLGHFARDCNLVEISGSQGQAGQQITGSVPFYQILCRIQIHLLEPCRASFFFFTYGSRIVEFSHTIAIQQGVQCHRKHLKPVHPEARLIVLQVIAKRKRYDRDIPEA